VRLILVTAILIGLLGLVGGASTHAASPRASSRILYSLQASPAHESRVADLWTTDSTGRHAQLVVSVKPVDGQDSLRGAYLVPDGLILAKTSATDGNTTDIAFVKRGSHQLRLFFSVRGLFTFRPSPDGQEIAYSRSLPVAGKPLLVIVRGDGTVVRTLAHATSKALSWSDDGRRLFAYGVSPDCWFCVFSVATGARAAIKTINLNNLWGGSPSVSPSGTRIAFPDAKGPAGERIYTTKGAFLRNIVGHAVPLALWSPDEAQLLLQPQDDVPRVFSFRAKRLTSLAHDGPADLRVLDWR
jgi:Tol biopolymer transport system component